jgi:hypothetical protein
MDPVTIPFPMNSPTSKSPRETGPTTEASGITARTWSRYYAVLAFLVAGHLALGVHCACSYSVTHDEYWHLPAGLSIFKTGRFDADNLNPPLSRIWSAIPLALAGIPMGEPATPNDSTALGDHFLDANLSRYHVLYAWGRCMNLAWSVLAGILIAEWGRKLFSPAAGLIGASLWFCCPVVLSNAALVTPDLCTAFFFLATTYAAWRFAREPGFRLALMVGALLGLSQLAKFTCVVLYPAVVAAWVAVRVRAGIVPVTWRQFAARWGTVFAVSLLVLNAGYLFRGTMRPLSAYRFASSNLQAIANLTEPVAGLWVPAPSDYVVGFDRQRSIMEAKHPIYLDGELVSGVGFRDYYLRACAYKWPHATQALVLTALAALAFASSSRRLWRTHAVVLFPAVLTIGIASISPMQLGIRYILPAFPLIYLFTGHVGTWFHRPRALLQKMWVAVCVPGLLLGLRYHPHHLAYFNELSGGPLAGPTHLLDSNIDWGQDLGELQAYLRAQPVDSLALAYFGMLPPGRLGFQYHFPPALKELRGMGGIPPGWYAVSVNFVQGRPHTIRDANGAIRAVGPMEFGYFQSMKPVARIGWSINVYRVE